MNDRDDSETEGLDGETPVGAEATRSVRERATKPADPHAEMAQHWLRHGIGPRQLAERLVAADAARPPTDDQMAEYEARWRASRDAQSIVIDMLANADRLTGFARKTRERPADHTWIVRDLALISRPVLPLEEVEQSVEPDGRCQLRFSLAGKIREFHTKNAGREVDVASVLAALNDLLAELGRNERFFELYTGDHTVLVLFAQEEPFLAAARDLRIPLLPDSVRRPRPAVLYKVIPVSPPK